MKAEIDRWKVAARGLKWANFREGYGVKFVVNGKRVGIIAR